MVLFDSAADAETTEAEILEAVEPCKREPSIQFSGSTECFSATSDQLAAVISYMTGQAELAKGTET